MVAIVVDKAALALTPAAPVSVPVFTGHLSTPHAPTGAGAKQLPSTTV